MQFEVGRRYFVAGQADDFSWYEWQHRFGSHNRWDARLSLKKQKTTELALAFSWYW
jgi:hypothetical protein